MLWHYIAHGFESERIKGAYGMNSADASASKHCDGKFHKHGQVNNDCVALSNAHLFQIVCQLYNNKKKIIP